MILIGFLKNLTLSLRKMKNIMRDLYLHIHKAMW